ncbi:MAG TPA: shikimate dehydrogenase [Thermodesulfobacteriota bacterium]|nr:shikimate dehydrogenase [Thermodesulfobacteriota bacterium]
MNIEATTKVYGIFGHPVSHSLSPKMHNAAFRALDINSLYVAFDIDPKDLEIAARAIKPMGIRGINITIPHKENIIFFLDEISEEASLTGAVNTVTNEDGKLKGYNTDVGGFLKAIKEDLGFHPAGMQAVVLGAGGAARAVVTALCMNDASGIYVINRTFDKAKKLVNEFKKNFKDISIEAVSLDDKQGVKDSLNLANILVNSTSAGMKGTDPIEIPLEHLPEESVVYDLVYSPRETDLIKKSKEIGRRASGGLSMLIYQGAESFEIWTGEKAPTEIMRKAIEEGTG